MRTRIIRFKFSSSSTITIHFLYINQKNPIISCAKRDRAQSDISANNFDSDMTSTRAPHSQIYTSSQYPLSLFVAFKKKKTKTSLLIFTQYIEHYIYIYILLCVKYIKACLTLDMRRKVGDPGCCSAQTILRAARLPPREFTAIYIYITEPRARER